ncbi:MAG: DUF1800 domain-containing protein [Bacteroidetes bacterium]|nr:DUF1800 domain-containing protein [Bacteroidota bacterium]
MQPDIVIDEPVSLSMTPYAGTWSRAEAAHLLRRTLVGPNFQQIQNAVTNGMNATVASLLTPNAVGEPLTYDPDEAIAPQGTTWVNSVYPSDPTSSNLTDNARRRSLYAWMMERLNSNSLSIAEKMTLFWVNHFALEQQFDSRSTYSYYKLLRDNSLGNFKQLVKDVTIHPEMLLFLNGSSNNLYSPNENFSRELLELFTIGKGPQIGDGDYTYYTEEDVAAGAKILTGWTVQGLRSASASSVTSSFQSNLHVLGTKQLSSKFGGANINSNGAQEYADYIDVIFQQNQCAIFLCKKLYRYFVNYDLTTDVENNVIPILAGTLISNGYNVLPVLNQLLKSEHFYDLSLRGTQIKTPIEVMFTKLNSSMSVPQGAIDITSKTYLNVHYLASNLGQNYFAPPNVGGWPAYYQAPSYSKLWLNSTFIKQRFDIALWLSIYNGINISGTFYKVRALQLVDSLSYPSSPVDVIDDLCDLYFSKPVTSLDKTNLKNILTNSLPDFEWTDQYNEYIQSPTDPTKSDPVRQRVELVLASIYRMAQFQTI